MQVIQNTSKYHAVNFTSSVCQTYLHKVFIMFKCETSVPLICHITDYEPSTQTIMNQLGDFCFPFSLGKCTQLMTLICMILLMTLYCNLLSYSSNSAFRLGQIL